MKAKEHWHCTGLRCGCQVVVAVGDEVEGQDPRCACGTLMEKKYTSPASAYLDFLRVESAGGVHRDLSEVSHA
jgi:hypothetical protein